MKSKFASQIVVLRNEENETVNSTASATAVETAPQRILVHTRNDEDRKNLTENFDISKLGKPSFVTGLMTDAQTGMVKAAAKGYRIVTTGLPIDIAAELGEVTLVRAWPAKTNDDGSKRAGGSRPPANYFAGKIHDADAFAALKALPEFAKAFSAVEEGDEAEGEAEAF